MGRNRKEEIFWCLIGKWYISWCSSLSAIAPLFKTRYYYCCWELNIFYCGYSWKLVLKNYTKKNCFLLEKIKNFDWTWKFFEKCCHRPRCPRLSLNSELSEFSESVKYATTTFRFQLETAIVWNDNHFYYQHIARDVISEFHTIWQLL